jgi:hypothetical protein
MEFSANTITEAIYNSVDEDGMENVLFLDIIDHRNNSEASLKEQAQLTPPNEQSNKVHPCFTTKGWEICIAWQDGSTSWHKLSDVKNAYPLQLAEYVTKNGIANKPAFAWWVKPMMKQRKLYIKSSHTRYAKRTHKFGIRVPRTVEEALRIDKETNTNLIFNVKMDFNRKAHFVAWGHMANPLLT